MSQPQNASVGIPEDGRRPDKIGGSKSGPNIDWPEDASNEDQNYDGENIEIEEIDLEGNAQPVDEELTIDESKTVDNESREMELEIPDLDSTETAVLAGALLYPEAISTNAVPDSTEIRSFSRKVAVLTALLLVAGLWGVYVGTIPQIVGAIGSVILVVLLVVALMLRRALLEE